MDLLGIADKSSENWRWSWPHNTLTKVSHVSNITVSEKEKGREREGGGGREREEGGRESRRVREREYHTTKLDAGAHAPIHTSHVK